MRAARPARRRRRGPPQAYRAARSRAGARHRTPQLRVRGIQGPLPRPTGEQLASAHALVMDCLSRAMDDKVNFFLPQIAVSSGVTIDFGAQRYRQASCMYHSQVLLPAKPTFVSCIEILLLINSDHKIICFTIGSYSVYIYKDPNY
jgi:hypothetical protein